MKNNLRNKNKRYVIQLNMTIQMKFSSKENGEICSQQSNLISV